MPKDDLVRMTCGYCHNTDTFNIREKAEVLLPILQRWHGYTRGDRPPSGQGADGMEWYDSVECMVAGIKQNKSQEEHQAAMDAALQKADTELKSSPYAKIAHSSDMVKN